MAAAEETRAQVRFPVGNFQQLLLPLDRLKRTTGVSLEAAYNLILRHRGALHSGQAEPVAAVAAHDEWVADVDLGEEETLGRNFETMGSLEWLASLSKAPDGSVPVVTAEEKSTVHRPLLMPLLLGAAAVIFLWSDTPFDVDEAMITYRYAENLAAGRVKPGPFRVAERAFKGGATFGCVLPRSLLAIIRVVATKPGSGSRRKQAKRPAQVNGRRHVKPARNDTDRISW